MERAGRLKNTIKESVGETWQKIKRNGKKAENIDLTVDAHTINAATTRLIPGEEGIVTGGSPTALGRNFK